MEPIKNALCSMNYHAKKCGENSIVAYYTSGYDQTYHIKSVLEDFEKLSFEVQKLKNLLEEKLALEQGNV